MNNLSGSAGGNQVSLKQNLRAKSISSNSDPRLVKKSMTDIDDAEDARLLKEQTINQSNLDYSDLSKKLLLHCNQQRVIPMATPEAFLKKRQGKQAWGPQVKDSCQRTQHLNHYGSAGFTTTKLKTMNKSQSVQKDSCADWAGFRKYDSSEDFANLSTETITHTKKAVLRRNLSLPKYLQDAL